MPIVLPALSEQQIMLALPEKDDPDHAEYAKFRAATIAEQLIVSDFAAKRETQTIMPGGGVTYHSDYSMSTLRRLQVYMTLSGCSLLDRDPVEPENPDKFHPLFSFQKIDGKARFAGTEEDFNRAWGHLPATWAEAIIVAMLEVNPHWNPKLGE